MKQPTIKQGLTTKLRADAWIGPYTVNDVFENGNIKIVINGSEKIVNKARIKRAETPRDNPSIDHRVKSCLRRVASTKRDRRENRG